VKQDTFWSQIYERQLASVEPLDRQVCKLLDNFGKLGTQHELVLDVGCGNGRFLDYLRARFGTAQAVGLDLSVAGLRSAERFGVFVVRSAAEHIPFRDSFFSAVICVHTLEHVIMFERVIEEIARVTSHGGKLLIITPNAIRNTHMVFWIGTLYEFMLADHVRTGFAFETLKAKLKKSGFQLDTWGWYGFAGSFLGWIVRVCYQLPLKILGCRHGQTERRLSHATDAFVYKLELLDRLFSTSNNKGANLYVIATRS